MTLLPELTEAHIRCLGGDQIRLRETNRTHGFIACCLTKKLVQEVLPADKLLSRHLMKF